MRKTYRRYDAAKLSRLKREFKKPYLESRIMEKYGNKVGSEIVLIGRAYVDRGGRDT